MLMNDIGVPMNDAEFSMVAQPGKMMLKQHLETSGLESQWEAALIGAGVSIIGSIFGGNKAASAARQEAEMRNQASARQLTWDTEKWNMDKLKIQADREAAILEIQTKARNEGKRAAWQDAVNLQKYNYDLQNRDRQQRSNEEQFKRSDNIYNSQLTLNAASAKSARENEYRSLQEIHAEASFDRQEQQIKAIQTEGQLRARGANGKSISKANQVTQADLGRAMALANESLDAAGRNTQSVLEEIARDQSSADLAALAQKMLDPGVLPDVIQPIKTPMADYVYPREIGEYDYGPEPVLGAIYSPSAAANKVWGSTISGIAGTAGGAIGQLPNEWFRK